MRARFSVQCCCCRSCSQRCAAVDPADLEFPLTYAEGEAEGRGWLCPSLLSPTDRVLLVARQSFTGRFAPEGGTSVLRLYVPAFRNLGEQRRLASSVMVKLDGAPLAHQAELVYSRPYASPFLRIACAPTLGTLDVQVDSWLSHASPPDNPTRLQLQLVNRAEPTAAALSAFNAKYQIVAPKHWWTDPEGQLSPRPRALGVAAKGALPTVQEVLQATAKQVRFELNRNSLVPAEAWEAGDSGSRASVAWYCLQNELPTMLVAGYSRELVDQGGRGWNAWNCFCYAGFLIGDARGGTPYLGADQANYLATGIGCDHQLADFPTLPRHATYNSGCWYTEGGRLTSDKGVVLAATSAYGRLGPTGKMKVSGLPGEAGCGPQQNDLNRMLANPPAGIVELSKQVDRERKRINVR